MPHNTDEITAKLTDVFHEVFDDDSIELRRDMTADDVEDWDSLAHMRLILSVENSFGLRLPSTKVGGLKNVGELIDLIAACQDKGASA